MRRPVGHKLQDITPGLSGTLSWEFINKKTRYENSARLSGVS
jgi:hypothetical protein